MTYHPNGPRSIRKTCYMVLTRPSRLGIGSKPGTGSNFAALAKFVPVPPSVSCQSYYSTSPTPYASHAQAFSFAALGLVPNSAGARALLVSYCRATLCARRRADEATALDLLPGRPGPGRHRVCTDGRSGGHRRRSSDAERIDRTGDVIQQDRSSAGQRSRLLIRYHELFYSANLSSPADLPLNPRLLLSVRQATAGREKESA